VKYPTVDEIQQFKLLFKLDTDLDNPEIVMRECMDKYRHLTTHEDCIDLGKEVECEIPNDATYISVRWIVTDFIQERTTIRRASPDGQHRLGLEIIFNKAWNLITYHMSVPGHQENGVLDVDNRTQFPEDSEIHDVCTFHIYSPRNGKFNYETVMNYWDLGQWLSLDQSGAEALKWTDSLIVTMPIFAKHKYDWDDKV
jgi:hypothetical protein